MASKKNVISSNYNTRRKSLSLSSMGINVPVSHAARNAGSRTPSISPDTEYPSQRKRQRTHDNDTKSSTSMSPPPKRQATTIKVFEHTPPPSPPASSHGDLSGSSRHIDLELINDEIVRAAIEHLQETGNKPIIVKQLAELLQYSAKVVEQSANQSAIISSRLTTYIKRACWTSTNPCPLAKELEPVHPRRAFFYLTTIPHQPIGDTPTSPIAFQAHSPPLSSTHSHTDSTEEESRRRELSPSPEVDLSVHDLSHDEDVDISDEKLLIAPPMPTGSFSGRLVATQKDVAKEAVSPPLDRCEKEFQQTVSMSKQRRVADGNGKSKAPTSDVSIPPSGGLEMDVARGEDYRLFGFGSQTNNTPHKHVVTTSAIITTAASVSAAGAKVQETGDKLPNATSEAPSSSWESHRMFHHAPDDAMDWDFGSPEQVDLAELDELFADY